MPLLEHEQAPDPGTVVTLSGGVQIEHLLHGLLPEIPTPQGHGVEENRPSVVAKLLLEPGTRGNSESLFGLLQGFLWEIFGSHAAKQVLRDAVSKLERV